MELFGLTLGETLVYLWQRLPLILLFTSGYLVYRLLDVTGLTDAFVRSALARGGQSASRLLFMIMGAAALLSFFIPNAITVLTLLPVLKSVDQELSENHGRGTMTTALTLSAIYGANIGGMGSLIGSPANLMLVGMLDYFAVPGREQITFVGWFVWAVPLVALFLLLAWGVVRLAVPRRLRLDGVRLTARGPRELSPWQRSGMKLFSLFLVFWIGTGVAVQVWPGYAPLQPAVCSGFFLFFLCMLFFRGGPPCQSLSCPLLRPRDVFSELPLRGLALLAVLGAVILAAQYFRLGEQAAGLFGYVAEALPNQALLTGAMVLAVVLLTEVFSNSLVSLAFFPLAFFTALQHGIDPLLLMLAVSIASTCAFMTPIATPCNALAFGEMRGTRFGVMLGLGLVLNLLGAALMSAWVVFVVPKILG